MRQRVTTWLCVDVAREERLDREEGEREAVGVLMPVEKEEEEEEVATLAELEEER